MVSRLNLTIYRSSCTVASAILAQKRQERRELTAARGMVRDGNVSVLEKSIPLDNR